MWAVLWLRQWRHVSAVLGVSLSRTVGIWSHLLGDIHVWLHPLSWSECVLDRDLPAGRPPIEQARPLL